MSPTSSIFATASCQYLSGVDRFAMSFKPGSNSGRSSIAGQLTTFAKATESSRTYHRRSISWKI